MNYYEKSQKLNDTDFKQIIGVKRETFSEMVEVLKEAYVEKHKKGGRNRKLSIEEQLFMTLKYLRQYVTQKELSYEFEVGEATVHDTIVWVENTLVKDKKFSLPGKKTLVEDQSIEVVLVDVTECPVERPKKKQKKWYSGKKKRHTVKAQVIVRKSNMKILCVAENMGKTHDFKLYKDSVGHRMLSTIKAQADSGYQGITTYHLNSETPKKKPRGGQLTAEEKAENKRISRERIYIEHINAKIKVFKIMKYSYRNRRKRHFLRLNLICAIINFDEKF